MAAFARSLLQAGAQRTLSHRRLRKRPLAGDPGYISTKEIIARLSISSTAVYTAPAPNRIKDFWRD
jgi:hypothetical protein